MEIYNPRKAARIVTLRGRILAPTYAELYDKIEALAVAFDPDTIAWTYGNENMFLPLTFSTPTTDTATYPSGFMSCQYLCIPAAMPEPVISDTANGTSATFKIDLLLRDPRRYLQLIRQHGGNTTFTNIGDFRSWPTITFSTNDATGDNFTITVTGPTKTYTLVLDLGALVFPGDDLIVDCENARILLNGVETASIWVSGEYPEIEPGSITVAYTNGFGVINRVLSHYPAFSS